MAGARRADRGSRLHPQRAPRDHETAGHIRCDHEHRRDISTAQRETEADSVAYVVLAALGLDISSSTVEYVADWSRGDTNVLRAAAETVHRVAAAVLADLDHPHATAA